MKHVGMIHVRSGKILSQSVWKMLIVQKEIGCGLYVTYASNYLQPGGKVIFNEHGLFSNR